MEKIRPLFDNSWNPSASAKDNFFRECTGFDESGWIRNAENPESCNPSLQNLFVGHKVTLQNRLAIHSIRY